MRPLSQPASISRQLTGMNMLVTTAALLLVAVAYGAYDFLTFRDSTLGGLSIQAQIVGSNSVSALLFNDARAAEQTLAALAAAPGVVSAHVYSKDGRLFASYWRGADGVAPPPPPIPGEQQEYRVVTAGSAELARRIVFDGMPAGTVYIRSDLQALYERLWRGGLMSAGVLFAAALAAWLLSRRAQRSISQPLVEMAALARRVSVDRDYSVRATAQASFAELAVLTESFNEMLARIQRRDRSLQEAQAELEERVRQRTAELDATNKELESFSYSVSHDLRSPLRHVTGFANLLEQHAGPNLDAQATRYLRTITDAASRMGTLIDDLIAFSRAGRASLNKRRVDLTALVHEARSEVAVEADGRRIVWDVHPLPAVSGDPALLRPALVNLLSNAVKYTSTRDEAHIEIGTVDAGGQEVVVYVRDNGVGFDMTYAHKLFGVFQRLHRADEFAGTGIGLANVRRIIQRHGGRTWAAGAVDAGATFYFSLPATPDGA